MKSSPTKEEVAMNNPEIMNDNHIDSPPKSVASSSSSASSSSTLTDSPSELSSFSSPGLGVPKEVTSSNNSSSSEINQTTTPETISTITKKRKNQKHPSLPTIPSGGTIQEQLPDSEPESEPKPESEHKPKPEHEYEHDPQPLKQTHNDDINSYIPGAESGLSTFGSENTGVSYDSMSDNGEDREGKKQHKEEYKQQSTPPKSNSKKKKKKKKKAQSGDNPPSHMIKRRRRKLATIEPDSCSYYIFQEEEEKRQKEQQQQQNDDNNSDNDDNNDDNNSDNNSDHDDETEENTNNKQQEQQHVEYSNNEKDKRRFMLPHNQYECILRRRAIVKEENKLQHSNIDTPRSTSSPAQLPKEKITMTTNVTKRRTLFANFKATTTQPSATNNNNGNNSDDNRSDKNSTKTSSIDPKQKQSQSECLHEIYGDTTVGMKLSILSGKVIILSIIPLNDGRASPAQLVGHIQRGDVILSINNKSLVNVPFDEVSVLVDRLAPLSHPSSKDGLVFDREVKIRFEVGTGLELLEKDNSKKNNAIQQQKKKQQSVDDYDGIERKENPVVGNGTSTANNMDGANDLFNLSKFAFVDQFTGQPFFDDHDMNINEMKKNDTNRNQRYSLPTTIETSEEDNSQQIDTPKKRNESKRRLTTSLSPIKKLKFYNAQRHHYQSLRLSTERHLSSIGYACGVERVMELMKFSNSAYFLTNQNSSPILRLRISDYGVYNEALNNNNGGDKSLLNQKEMIIYGKRVLSGVNLLLDQVQFGTKQKKGVNPLKMVYAECQSFSSRSRFSQRSQRKKFLMTHEDIADVDENDNDNDDSSTSSEDNVLNDSNSFGSNELGESDNVGGDEMLLRLAVWNRTWKKNMVETLDAASVHRVEIDLREPTSNTNGPVVKKKNKTNGLESQLRNLFFGEQVIDVINKKKPATLPPDDITEVLYDLALSVSSTVPLNVDVIGEINSSLQDIPVTEHDENISPRLSSSKKKSEIYEATRFLLDDIIPLWLNTFRPIQMQQRRVMWSMYKDGSSNMGTPDDLSIVSSATGWSTNSPERRDKLEERIASMELDPDTKAETCHLITFYFKRKVMLQLQNYGVQSSDSFSQAETMAIEFIEKFGAYMNLYEALETASDYFSKNVIQKLLDLASHDPSHTECLKLFTKSGMFSTYEPKFLSCLLLRLPSLDRQGKGKDNSLAMLKAAYPDLKPWQLRSSIFSVASNCNEILNSQILCNAVKDDIIFYYEYLTLLMKSSQMARSNKSMVKEWCFLSVSQDFSWEDKKRRQRFLSVATIESGENKLVYNRDLLFLIETSDMIKEHSLTLKLATEIISLNFTLFEHDIITKVVNVLHNTSRECLKSNVGDDNSPFDNDLMRRILILWNRIASSSDGVLKEMVDVCVELGVLLDQCKEQSDDAILKEETLINLMAESISSANTLETLSNRSTNHLSSAKIVTALRTCLEKGAEEGTDDEISSALLRLRKVRPSVQSSRGKCQAPSIWNNLLLGTAMIDK